jgi:signal peptide peptidase SppA
MSHFLGYPHLAARIFNVALLVHPQKLDAIIAGLGQRLLGSTLTQGAAPAGLLAPELFTSRKGPRSEIGYQVVDGVAVLNVNGALVHKTRLEADSSTLLGYNSIYADLAHAMDNPDVHAVLQVWDSPGGEAQGAFQYAEQALALRGKKPFYAIADGMAASAGYLGASAAEQLAITSTGYAGSIGVVMRHVDVSAALMNDGVRVSHIYAGAKKIDGNSFEPLSAAVRADFQAEVDSLYATFIDAVAASRQVSPQALRATEAATYRGQAAITAGLADRISSADALITELVAKRSRTFTTGQKTAHLSTADTGAHMSQTSNTGGQLSAIPQPPAAPAQPDAPTMKTFTQSELDAATATALASGSATERARISAIQSHANASAQPGIVRACIDTGMTAEQAATMLGAAVGSAQASAAASPFAAAMAGVANPAVTGIEGSANTGPEAEAAAMAAQVLQTMRSFA